jgi:hypothetical protein
LRLIEACKIMAKSQVENIHIGNAGEHYLAAQLSKYCVVRDVSQGKDTGIDFYCEILHEDTLELALHFFCQVKTQKTMISINSIKDTYWTYWGEQPVPVFLMLIKYKTQDDIQNRSRIWVYDIPYILAKRDAEHSGKKLPTRNVEEKFLICKASNDRNKMTWRDFVYHHVPWSYGLWYMRRFGLVLPNPEIVNRQQQVLVGGFSYLYREKIQKAMEYSNALMKRENSSN